MIRFINCPHKRARVWPHAGVRDDQTERSLQRRRQEKYLSMCLPRCVLPFSLLPSAVCLYAWCGKSGIKLIPCFAALCLVPEILLKVHFTFPLRPWIKASFIQCPQTVDLLWVLFNLLSVCECFFRIEMWQWNRCWSGLCASCSVY